MSKCNFSISFLESAESVISKAETAIKNANGSFSGDTRSGSFALSTPLGMVSGIYNIENFSINIKISDKPIFLGCSKIQTELQKYLSVG